MNSLHFRLEDAESFVNDLFMRLHIIYSITDVEHFVVCTAV